MAENLIEKIKILNKKIQYVDYSTNSTFGSANYAYPLQGGAYSGNAFKRSINTIKSAGKWNAVLNRSERFVDYELMDSHPVISNALDIIADDIIAQDSNNDIINIKSDNSQLVADLELLFHEVLDVEYNLWFWARNMLKFGDCYNLLQIHQDFGIVNCISLPANYVERKEDITENGYEISFSFLNQANPISNEEMMDFRIYGDEKFFPYGKSILEPIRRTWKQLRLLEDSMLIYRVARSSERRIFYVEVGNLTDPAAVESYINEIKTSLQSSPVIDPDSGEIDLRYGPSSQLDDFFVPVRGGVETNKVDMLKGGDNQNQIEDVKFIHQQMISGLKVPAAFLNYEENINAKATALVEDIRYARTIQRFQKMVINELYKAAYVHLSILGYKEEDITSFEINLFNPSQISEIQKLNVLEKKCDVAEKLKNFYSDQWIYEEIFELSDQEIKTERQRRVNEIKFNSIIELVKNIKSSGEIGKDIESIMNIKFNYEQLFSIQQEKEENKEPVAKQKLMIDKQKKLDNNKIKNHLKQFTNNDKKLIYDYKIIGKNDLDEDVEISGSKQVYIGDPETNRKITVQKIKENIEKNKNKLSN